MFVAGTCSEKYIILCVPGIGWFRMIEETTAVLEDIRFMSGWNMYDTGARAAIEVDRGYVESRNKNGARLRA